MMILAFKKYADLRGVDIQTALEECENANALVINGNTIAVDIKKINGYLDVKRLKENLEVV